MTRPSKLAAEFRQTARSYDRQAAAVPPADRQLAHAVAEAYRHAARRVRVVLVSSRARETDGGTP